MLMDNTPFVAEGLDLVTELADDAPVVAGQTAVCQRLAHTSQLIAALLARRRPDTAVSHENLTRLLQKLDRHFNDSELRDLAFQLQVEYDDLVGPAKRDKARELVTYLDRRNRVDDLVQQVSVLRPNTGWRDKAQRVGGEEIVSRLDVAVAVEIARPTVKDVARYLDERGIEANFILLQHRHPGQFLTPGDDWEAIVKAFSQAMNETKRHFGGARLHFFLTAPGALLFGFGCIWGTVDEGIVYHYESGSYTPVITISRELR